MIKWDCIRLDEKEVSVLAKDNVKSYETENRANRNRRTQRTYSEKQKAISKASPKKVEKEEKENTTRIRIDRERLDEVDSLDTSFLEGRVNKRVNKNSKAKEKILIEKKDHSAFFKILKLIGLGIIVLGVVVALFVLITNHKSTSKTKKSSSKPVVVEKEKEEDKEIDDNYLFVGDFHTDKLEFDESFDHFVKETDEGMTTFDLLEDLKNKVYVYNPSVVFIQLGINDLNEGSSIDEIIENYVDIIDQIKENRPYAKIYIESIYPINKEVEDYDEDLIDVEADDIIEVNTKLESLAKEKKISYLDMFDLLSDNDELNSKYTDNGVYINESGYKQILKKIRSVVDEKEEGK